MFITDLNCKNKDAIAKCNKIINNKHYKNILLVMGGTSHEKEISIQSGENIYKQLVSCNYNVEKIYLQSDIKILIDKITTMQPDAVFNALHGKNGEDGKLQGVLSLLKIPFTHSGVLASSICMNKSFTKKILKTHGIEVPNEQIIYDTNILLNNNQNFAYPYVIKPLEEGSSIGVNIINNKNDLIKLDLKSLSAKIMIEGFIPGKDLSVAVIDGHSLGVTEINTKHHAFYSYESKYHENGCKHILPANIDEEVYITVQKIAIKAHEILGCNGITRSDFRYCSEAKKLVFLEINTQPGFAKQSISPEQAESINIDCAKLCCWITELAKLH